MKIAFAQQNSAVANPITSEEKVLNSQPAAGHGIGVRVMQNTAALLVGRGAALVLAAIASIWLVRCLAPEQLGKFAAIYAFLGLFTWVASWGVGPLIAREAALNREQAGSIVFTGFCISAAFTGAAVALAFAVAPVFHLAGKIYPLLCIAAVEILLMVPFGLPSIIFQVDLRQWYSSLFNVIRQVFWLGVVIAAYFAGAPLLYIIAGRLGVAAIETALNWHYGRRLLAPHAVFLSPLAKRLIRGGLVITLTTVASTIYLRIDQVMLHRMATDAALGQYAAAVRISEFFEALPAAFGSSLFPLLVISIADSPRFRRHLDLGYRYMILASVALSIFFCTGARPVLHLLYGAKYAAAAPLLAILIWAEVAVFFGSTLANAWFRQGAGKEVIDGGQTRGDGLVPGHALDGSEAQGGKLGHGGGQAEVQKNQDVQVVGQYRSGGLFKSIRDVPKTLAIRSTILGDGVQLSSDMVGVEGKPLLIVLAKPSEEVLHSAQVPEA